jgi:parallel beta-helix repeat protein
MSEYTPPPGGPGNVISNIGVNVADTVTVWESAGTFAAQRNIDGVIISSGLDWDEVMRVAVLEAAEAGSIGGTIKVKPGQYTFNSGVTISGDVAIIGEGGLGPSLQAGSLGATSGVFIMAGTSTSQRVSNFDLQCNSGHMVGIHVGTNLAYARIDNVLFQQSSAASGTRAIVVNGADDMMITNLKEVRNWDTGIYLHGGSNNNIINNVTVVGCHYGIELNGADQNVISNIIGESANLSGVVLLESGALRNVVSNIIGGSTSVPVVVVRTSGIENTVTNVLNRSGGPAIVDLTSGARNYLMPGELRPAVLISGSSPYTYVNASGRQEMISITAGTVSQIDFVRAGTTTTISGATTGQFILNAGDKITVTYSAAPTIQAIPTT